MTVNKIQEATPAASELERLDRADVLHGFSAPYAQGTNEVVVIREAQGMRVVDERGREFLDAGGGLWCMNVGYGRKSIAAAAAAQIKGAMIFMDPAPGSRDAFDAAGEPPPPSDRQPGAQS